MGSIFENTVEYFNNLRKRQRTDSGLATQVGKVINQAPPSEPAAVQEAPMVIDLGHGPLAELYQKATIKPDHLFAVKLACKKILAHKDVYLSVERQTNVPWFAVACIHSLESGLDFSACLHNGERIIGTGKKTKLVPKGKGPFNTWHEAAIDALGGPGAYKKQKWTIQIVLDFLEKYNGLGYRKRGMLSPYLWSFTNFAPKGRYVADGVFDPNAESKQCGAVALMKALGV